VSKPDPSLLEGVVAREVLDALEVASAALGSLGVRHVVVGGLAVGANGFPRATRDVDFLVGEEAFEHHAGGLVTLRAGVPFQVRSVAVDFIAPELLRAAQDEIDLQVTERSGGSAKLRPPVAQDEIRTAAP